MSGSCDRTRTDLLLEHGLPQRQETGAAEQRLEGGDRQQRQVQGAPPEHSHKPPIEQAAERDRDQAEDVERDHGDMGREHGQGEGSEQVGSHRASIFAVPAPAEARLVLESDGWIIAVGDVRKDTYVLQDRRGRRPFRFHLWCPYQSIAGPRLRRSPT